MSYTIEITREGDTWIADVIDVSGAHTHAKNLTTLAERIQEVIGLVLDRPEDERFDVDLRFVGVDPEFAAAAELGRERVELERRQRDIGAQTEASAVALSRAGWSVRDIGGALRVTPGRVSQVVSKAGS